MTIYDKTTRPVATTQTTSIGREFLFGMCRLRGIAGYTLVMTYHSFVFAEREGRQHVIEDRGEEWILHRVVPSGANGYALTGETVNAPKLADSPAATSEVANA